MSMLSLWWCELLIIPLLRGLLIYIEDGCVNSDSYSDGGAPHNPNSPCCGTKLDIGTKELSNQATKEPSTGESAEKYI